MTVVDEVAAESEAHLEAQVEGVAHQLGAQVLDATPIVKEGVAILKLRDVVIVSIVTTSNIVPNKIEQEAEAETETETKVLVEMGLLQEDTSVVVDATLKTARAMKVAAGTTTGRELVTSGHPKDPKGGKEIVTVVGRLKI